MKKYNVKNYIRYKEDLKVSMPVDKPYEFYTRDELIVRFLPLVENISRNFATSQEASGAETAKVDQIKDAPKFEEPKPKFRFGIDDPTMPGVMTEDPEIAMNEKLYKFQKIYTDTVQKNMKIDWSGRSHTYSNSDISFLNKIIKKADPLTQGVYLKKLQILLILFKKIYQKKYIY